MALVFVKYDTATGKLQASLTPPSSVSIVDKDFTATASQTEFVADIDLTVAHTIDVFVDGRKMREGASFDYTKDLTNDKIVFNTGLIAGQWVQLRAIS